MNKGFSVASLVLGIIACTIAWGGIGLGITAVVCAIVAIVLAAMARKNGKNGMATAGLVLGIIGLVLSVIGTIACGICALAINEALKDLAIILI